MTAIITLRRGAGRGGLIFIALMSLSGCQRPASTVSAAPDQLLPRSSAALFAEDFESGTLDAWQDGVDPARHRIVTDPASAHSGRRYLAVTYPPRGDGGWLTRFLGSGHDSLSVSAYVRFPANWKGGTKLLALYGSRTDDAWSAFGKAGRCPDGADFFAAMLAAGPEGDPGPVRFYTYYPGMPREPDGVTCWGRFGDGMATYAPPLALGRHAWHRVELSVQLNTPGQADGGQAFWLDGVERGRWSRLRFRDSPVLRLNAVQLTFSASQGPAQGQEIEVDDVVVRTAPP